MKKLSNLILLFCLLSFFACNNDDSFSTDQNLKLSFSSDKISFDTVFSSVGSATKQFKIYNRNSKSIQIESIELVNPSESGFRMNIDGEKGTRLTNVEILKKDSLYGFVEVTVNPQNVNNPVLIKDSIKFTFNGNIQYLRLEAVGQDVYIWEGEIVTKDSIITDEKPLLVFDSLVVKENATLTVNKGVKFFMKENASVRIHGSLNIDGDVGESVVFRGDRFDNIEGDIPYDNVPGQWDGIYFYPESFENNLSNVVVKNATRGMTFYPSKTGYKKAVLMNTVVQNSLEYGIVSTNCDITASNSLFVNSRGAVLSLQGGKYTFLHCTVANYFRWSSRTEETVVLSNKYDGTLEKCDFINTIVYGSVSNEIRLDENSGKVFDFSFVNCVIRSNNQEDAHYINTVWNNDPLFKDVRSNGTFSYNFQLTHGSSAIDKADKIYSASLPYDIKGISRLNDTYPDIGCYEWVQ
ncbi:hypothetical protein GGR21_000483 [Dysgonomonas hofstadii]|uniref:Right handed beta helix region n=1 Tax=Dysgonomonas hofstadii TaxID=637886 RepID=A0A840CH57_9BACT|nr:choice-of-anchor Q domain-containing protein [Dysgonomonas hofstadii]MBB4034596.1 hypothetical protein [Dysgonomonas hofstadii]